MKQLTIDCRYCNGTGRIRSQELGKPSRQCRACGGTGVMHIDEVQRRDSDVMRARAEDVGEILAGVNAR
jgi:hypothetical protein